MTNKTLTMLIVLCLTLNVLCLVKDDANKTTTMSSMHPLSLGNLCPYRMFCQSPSLKEIRDDNFESCCEECSCENDCFEIGTCCPDKPLSGLVEPKYPCRNLWSFGKGVDMISVNLYNRDGWFHVIDGCPDTTNVLSYQSCYTPRNIIDYEVVIDGQTRKIYRNKHCAECNKIWNYDTLDLSMSCKDPFFITTLPTTEEREQYILANCSLRSLLPTKPFGLSHCFPESRLKQTCNTTGNWDTYNKEIETRCIRKSYDQNKIFQRLSNDDPRSYDYYANVYCFLCNSNSRVYRPDTCEIFKDELDSKTSFVTFQVILSTKTFEEDPAETDLTRCTHAQMWDPFTSVCRNLLCPSGQIPDNGKCKGIFSNINGYAVSMIFEVIIDNGTITSYEVLLRFLENRLMREIGTDTTCGVCSATLFAENGSLSQIRFRYKIYAKEGCLYVTLLERIRTLAIQKEMYLQFKYRNQVIRVMMALVFKDIDYSPSHKSLAESMYASCASVTMIGETILLYCPSFMLLSEENENIGLENETVHPLHHDTNSFKKVCVETYFAAKQANSTAAVVYFGAFKIFSMLSMLFQQNVLY